MDPIVIFAAGSLKKFLQRQQAQLEMATNTPICFQFGPAGWLRTLIEQGEHADAFLSANLVHPQALFAQGFSHNVHPFCHNTLCLTVSKRIYHPLKNWLNYLEDTRNRIAISTPKDDPSGDYALAFFEKLTEISPQLSQNLKHRAKSLVGSPSLPKVPSSHTAATWLIEEDKTDIFIGYSHYQSIINTHPQCDYVPIPLEWNIMVTYGATALTPKGMNIIEYLLTSDGQSNLQTMGFIPISSE